MWEMFHAVVIRYSQELPGCGSRYGFPELRGRDHRIDYDESKSLGTAVLSQAATAGTSVSPVLENAASTDNSSPLGTRTGEMVGDGGCTATALAKLGVFRTVRLAMDALNANIDVVKQKMRPDAAADYFGVPDDRWHPEAVKLSVTDAGYDFRKLKLQTVELRTLLKNGSYLIDGVLNDHYVMMDKGRQVDCYDDTGDTTTPASNEAVWRHSIAVRDGQILEKEFNMSSKWLWLDANNRLDRTKGYMYKILKVYEITRRGKKRSR